MGTEVFTIVESPLLAGWSHTTHGLRFPAWTGRSEPAGNQYWFSPLPACRGTGTCLQPGFPWHEDPYPQTVSPKHVLLVGAISLLVLVSSTVTAVNPPLADGIPVTLDHRGSACCLLGTASGGWRPHCSGKSVLSASPCLTRVNRQFLTLYLQHGVRATTSNKEMRPGLPMCSVAGLCWEACKQGSRVTSVADDSGSSRVPKLPWLSQICLCPCWSVSPSSTASSTHVTGWRQCSLGQNKHDRILRCGE